MAVASNSILPSLSAHQQKQLRIYEDLLRTFNRKINLISREAEGEIWERHILHSLALASRDFPAGCEVVDWGTGGGLPAIPLAIYFPSVTIHAVDSVGKKIQAVQTMARRLGLANLQAWHTRAEEWTGQPHYSVSRATAPLPILWSWHVRVRQPLSIDLPPHAWKPGLICLKGGDLASEIADLQRDFPGTKAVTTDLQPAAGQRHFEDKLLVEVGDGS